MVVVVTAVSNWSPHPLLNSLFESPQTNEVEPQQVLVASNISQISSAISLISSATFTEQPIALAAGPPSQLTDYCCCQVTSPHHDTHASITLYCPGEFRMKIRCISNGIPSSKFAGACVALFTSVCISWLQSQLPASCTFCCQ